MNKPLVFAVAFMCFGVVTTESRASDHIDGLKTSVDNAADLTDVFAFLSPQDSSKLVVVLNVHPVAFGGSQFSDAVNYQIRIRPVADATTLTPSADATQERGVLCKFTAPSADGGSTSSGNQHATCTLTLTGGIDTVSFDTRGSGYRAGGSGQTGTSRVFAGVRSDPWYLDAGKVLKYNAGFSVLPGPGINALKGANVLSIVVEVDASRLPGPLLAVNAQTIRQ